MHAVTGKLEPELPPALEQLLAEADRIRDLYAETAQRLNMDVLERKPYADAEVAGRYAAYAGAAGSISSQLRVRAREIAAQMEQNHG